MNIDRFRNSWNRCAGFIDSKCDEIYAEIEVKYNATYRYYHSSEHIVQCLKNMDEGAKVIGASDIVELAIWFHDVIYDSGASDNEARSVEWFERNARGSLPNETIDGINQAIMCTTHKSLPIDDSSKFVVDVDLSGFGQEWSEFTRDGDKIRQENMHLNIDDYVVGQIKFMEKLLDRERIYFTDYFNSKFEKNARRNIGRQLEIHYQCNA